MEKITIEHFGPLVNVEVILKGINIFTGTNGSGKSIVAKLTAIFNDSSAHTIKNFDQFCHLLDRYNINFPFSWKTKITYADQNSIFEVTNGLILITSKKKDYPCNRSFYISPERMFLTHLRKELKNASKTIKVLSVDFLNISCEFSKAFEKISLEDGSKIKLTQASSGFRSVIPLIMLVQKASMVGENQKKSMLVIEEPELHIHPSTQKSLTEFIITSVNNSNTKLIMLTHSPYVLTTLDNLIQANNAALAQPDRRNKITELISDDKWIDFARVCCYYFRNGTCSSILNPKLRLIESSAIDDVSIELSQTFEKLLAIKYGKGE